MGLIHQIDFTLTPPHGRATKADARLIPNGQPKPIVIFVHGFKGFKEWGYFNVLANYFAEKNFAFIKLNLSHNGSTLKEDDVLDLEAFGRNNFSIELDDVKALLDLLHSDKSPVPEVEIDVQKISLIGHSRGGGLTILASAEDSRIKATATWAAVSHLGRWSEEVLTKWQKEGVNYVANTRTKQQMPLYYQLAEDYFANKARFDVLAAAKQMPQPLLIIHGNKDETVPVQMAFELKEVKPAAALEIIEEANHTFGGTHPFTASTLPEQAKLAADKTIQFFQKFK
ncbi:alpha/beta hydrolase family protein [Adhaeribacter aquaticus]|uniref:alpha/beta hydrolase family protein n=1 Tax=Adhaeribacter aquaticus TaxID=299567 RepID=UPI0004072030|nr:alpha/beta fold hydrolase [Adhaeribacter aquaticus]